MEDVTNLDDDVEAVRVCDEEGCSSEDPPSCAVDCPVLVLDRLGDVDRALYDDAERDRLLCWRAMEREDWCSSGLLAGACWLCLSLVCSMVCAMASVLVLDACP